MVPIVVETYAADARGRVAANFALEGGFDLVPFVVIPKVCGFSTTEGAMFAAILERPLRTCRPTGSVIPIQVASQVADGNGRVAAEFAWVRGLEQVEL